MKPFAKIKYSHKGFDKDTVKQMMEEFSSSMAEFYQEQITESEIKDL